MQRPLSVLNLDAEDTRTGLSVRMPNDQLGSAMCKDKLDFDTEQRRTVTHATKIRKSEQLLVRFHVFFSKPSVRVPSGQLGSAMRKDC